MATKKDVKTFVIGTVAGAAVGVLTALLFAPKAGKELRKDIAEGAQQACETTVKLAGQVGETTGKIAKHVGSHTVQLAGKAKEAAGGVIGTVASWRTKGDDGEQAAIEETDTEKAG
ncbi:hypothetical protein BG53_12895 [Paenibacillus darwinianus]|uniref:General stress protein n=2 Tax=Paenibacillus darwinianus TaxID=1380763 RepID=A0A9W5W8D7_9BACL|nr:hypothetical protein CH50_01500 [Paenibacillus darwinianus]EXX90813.1 hypothetical protein BG53_12895 [Paenibacillus darwinianus]EXX90843.1 hypothetical protein BG52_12040 [Paenibacillus darwinianus]